MTDKTTPSGRALEALDSGDISWQMWLFENADIIRTALLRSHAIESGELPVSQGWGSAQHVASEAHYNLLERLKGIGHDE